MRLNDMMDEYYGICRVCSELVDEAPKGRVACSFWGFDQVPRKKRCKGFKENSHHDVDE